MALKLCEKTELENALWGVLKVLRLLIRQNLILNVLKDMGTQVDL